ncbi:hypothetical protein H8E77_04020 [bacterium]|nr:hypothetical protein [bacterium]
MKQHIPDEVLEAKTQLAEVLLARHITKFSAFETAVGGMGNENIVGVGIGGKQVSEKTTGEICVRVYVIEKVPLNLVEEQYRIPPVMNGIKTDVVEVGEVISYSHARRRFRPTPCGVSIAHYRSTAGTLGCLVKRDCEVYLLSNNHVIADLNNAQQGDAILQPSPLDGGTLEQDIIGTFSECSVLDFSGNVNQIDAAIAQCACEWIALPFILQIGEIRGVTVPQIGLSVKKMGRTTGLTVGVITDVEVDLRISYNLGQVARFTSQILISSTIPHRFFSLNGDSGALILDAQNFACALLCGGSRDRDITIANPIDAVLEEFQASLWTFPW